jgi:hypothetical protein
MIENIYEYKVFNGDVKRAALGGASVGGVAGLVIFAYESAPSQYADMEIQTMENQIEEDRQFSSLTPHQLKEARSDLAARKDNRPDSPGLAEAGGLIGGGLLAGVVAVTAMTAGFRAAKLRKRQKEINQQVKEEAAILRDKWEFDYWRIRISR